MAHIKLIAGFGDILRAIKHMGAYPGTRNHHHAYIRFAKLKRATSSRG